MRYTSLAKLRAAVGNKSFSVTSVDGQFLKTDSFSNPYQVPLDWGDFVSSVKVRSGNKMVNFVPYPYQRLIMELQDKHYGVIILKTRQLGISECFVGKFLQKALIDPNSYALFFSKKQDDTSLIASRTKVMMQSVENVKTVTDSAVKIQIKQGGVIQFCNSTPDSGRSVPSVTSIMYDEAAFIPDLGTLYGASMPTMDMLGDDGRVVMASTRGEDDNLYWELLNSYNGNVDLAKTIKSVANGELYCNDIPGFYYWIDTQGWAKVIVHWRAHPFYNSQPNYLEKIKTTKRLTARMLDKDYNLGAESTSGSGLVSLDVISECQELYGDYTPIDGRWRVATIDPNQGGQDYFVCDIWEMHDSCLYKIDSYREQKQRMKFSLRAVKKLCDRWSPNYGVIEANIESSFRDDLDLAVPYISWEKFVTNKSNKAQICESLAYELECGKVRFSREDPLGNELAAFDPVTLKAVTGHDDAVIAAALAVYAGMFGRVNDPAYSDAPELIDDQYSDY